MLFNILYVFPFLILHAEYICEGISVEEELTLTFGEKLALDKFRETVTNNLPQEYMKTDIYLIKWLRAKNFDVRAATHMLLKALAWRKKYEVDGILDEKFRFSEREYPFYFDGVDYTGRPVGTADVSVYDGRRAVVAGKIDEVYRYAIQALERGTTMVRTAQKKGFNVTQCSIIVNLRGFNLAQNACRKCIPHYIRFVLDYENYFPGMVHKIFFINTPGSVDVLVRILLPLASPYTKAAVLFYGTNKRKWQGDILKEIPANQIRSQFGGTLDDELDY